MMQMLRPRRPDRRRGDAPGGGDARAAIGTVVVAVFCCVGPMLVAGGVLAVLERFLPVTWIIPVAVALLLVCAMVWIRYGRGTRGERR